MESGEGRHVLFRTNRIHERERARAQSSINASLMDVRGECAQLTCAEEWRSSPHG